jgi:hypothetical protein
VDVNILKEIARLVQSRARVPERIHLQNRTFVITYLDDHRQRIEEALRRHDPDRLNMLFGQLESKVKYQVVRGSHKQPAGRPSRATSSLKSTASASRRPKAPGSKSAKKSPARAAKQATRQSKRPSSQRPAKSGKGQKSAARKAAPKRHNARKRSR